MSSPDKFLKLTYKLQTGKDLHAYLKMPSPTFEYLKKEIEMYFFRERDLPACEIRTFWFGKYGREGFIWFTRDKIHFQFRTYINAIQFFSSSLSHLYTLSI